MTTENPQIIIMSPQTWRYKNDPEYREHIKKRNYELRKKSFAENPESYERYKVSMRDYMRERYKNDPEFKAKRLESARKSREQKKNADLQAIS